MIGSLAVIRKQAIRNENRATVWVGNPAWSQRYSAAPPKGLGGPTSWSGRFAKEMLIAFGLSMFTWVLYALPIIFVTYVIPTTLFTSATNDTAKFMLLTGWGVFSFVLNTAITLVACVIVKWVVMGELDENDYDFFSSWFYRREFFYFCFDRSVPSLFADGADVHLNAAAWVQYRSWCSDHEFQRHFGNGPRHHQGLHYFTDGIGFSTAYIRGESDALSEYQQHW